MKHAHFKAMAAVVAFLGLQSVSDAQPRTIDARTAQAFAAGLRQAQAELQTIISQVERRRSGGGVENDDLADPLVRRALQEVTDAGDAAVSSAQNASVGRVPQAYADFMKACSRSAWAAADLGSAAFVALQPPPGYYTPFSDEITGTMNRIKTLRQSAGCF